MGIIYSRNKVFATRILENLSRVFLAPFVPSGDRKLDDVAKIVLIEPFQMGDVLSLTCLVEPLQSRFPHARISFWTKSSSGDVLRHDTRSLRVIGSDFPWADHGKKRFSLVRTLRAVRDALRLRGEKFDLGIETRGDVRSQILLMLAGCRIRLGYLNYLNSNIDLKGYLLTHTVLPGNYVHRYEWNLNVLTGIGFDVSQWLPVRFPSLSIPPSTGAKSNAVVVHVGGGWEFRRWAEEKWASLIDQLHDRYDSVTVIGGPGDSAILRRIEAQVVRRDRLGFATTTMEEMIHQIRDCVQFVGLDSGPMNLAVCLDKPTIALFGPGDSTMWRPLNKGGKFIQKTERFPCSPCLQLTCKFPSRNCMHEIEVSDVLKLLD